MAHFETKHDGWFYDSEGRLILTDGPDRHQAPRQYWLRKYWIAHPEELKAMAPEERAALKNLPPEYRAA